MKRAKPERVASTLKSERKLAAAHTTQADIDDTDFNADADFGEDVFDHNSSGEEQDDDDDDDDDDAVTLEDLSDPHEGVDAG